MYYNVPTIAEELEVSEETVRKWIRTGKLKAREGPHRAKYEVSEKDYDDFINSRERYKAVAMYKRTEHRINIIMRKLNAAIDDISDIEFDIQYQKSMMFSTFQTKSIKELQDKMSALKSFLKDISKEAELICLS